MNKYDKLTGFTKVVGLSNPTGPVRVGEVAPPNRIIEAHNRVNVSKVKVAGVTRTLAEVEGKKSPLDISWLLGASESLQISANIKDHILVAIPIVTASIPNRNQDCFPAHELAYYTPLIGRYTFATFIGKPTHQDHVNQDPRKAKGVHFDASMTRWSKNPNFWKVTVLASFDRSKDAKLANDILTRRRRGYSMGALVDHTRCSVCDEVSSDRVKCACMERAGKGGIFQGQLVYDCCHGINFIETSSVEDPADVLALSDSFLSPLS